jgi:hypothetical protein
MQAAACLADPACEAALTCMVGCIQGGGQPFQCFQQCGSNNKVIQAAFCAANNCGGGVCF